MGRNSEPPSYVVGTSHAPSALLVRTHAANGLLRHFLGAGSSACALHMTGWLIIVSVGWPRTRRNVTTAAALPQTWPLHAAAYIATCLADT